MAYDSNYTRNKQTLIDFIKELGFTTTQETVAGYTLTGYIKDKNLAVEYNKCDENDSLHVSRQFHYWRSRKCLEAGVRVINIWEDQLNDDRLWPTLQAIIKGALGINAENNTIYARKCQIKELDNKTYKDFCDANHTQKCRAAEIKLGLYCNDELVQVASFNKANSRNGVKAVKDIAKFDYEWVRGSFLGHYECLTENGWKRLDEMNLYKGKVAQWNKNTQQIEWTDEWKPVKEKKAELTTIRCSRSLVIEGNPEHTLPILNHDTVRDCWLTNLKSNHNDRILGSINPITNNKAVNPLEIKDEILNIIIQADGQVKQDSVYMRFCKQRKIDRLKYYLDLFNIPYTESDWKKENHEDNRKISNPVKTIVFNYPNASQMKQLYFDYTNMTKEKAEFLFEELSYWDGTRANTNYLQYFSADKNNADTAYTLCLLAGRKPIMFKHKAVWQVNMNKKPEHSQNYSLQNLTKETKPWNDYLYCLSVPSHYFIVRNDNHMFITHNCESFNQSRVIGGVSKLFNHFIKTYNPESVLCYSDFNFFCGLGYAKSGFTLDGYTGADKFYIDENGKRINRSASKYHEYMANVTSGKWLLCYGSGNLRMLWKRDDKKDDQTTNN